MKHIIECIINIIHNISFWSLLPLGVLAVLHEITDPAVYEKILSAIGIPVNNKMYWIVFSILIVLWFTTYFIKEKFFN